MPNGRYGSHSSADKASFIGKKLRCGKTISLTWTRVGPLFQGLMLSWEQGRRGKGGVSHVWMDRGDIWTTGGGLECSNYCVHEWPESKVHRSDWTSSFPGATKPTAFCTHHWTISWRQHLLLYMWQHFKLIVVSLGALTPHYLASCLWMLCLAGRWLTFSSEQEVSCLLLQKKKKSLTVGWHTFRGQATFWQLFLAAPLISSEKCPVWHISVEKTKHCAWIWIKHQYSDNGSIPNLKQVM